MGTLRHANCLAPQPSWMLRLQVGHVIARPSGPYRIVREVHRYGNGDLWSVSLVIRRCSWTHRCYTILNATDLRTFGYRRIRVKARRLTKRIDKQIVAALHQPAWDDPQNLVSLCADHHRLRHAGIIHISGNADDEIIVTGDVDRLRFRI